MQLSLRSTPVPAAGAAARAVMSPGRIAVRRAVRHAGFWTGGSILLVLLLCMAAAPLLSPHDPSVQDLAHRLAEPIWSESGDWKHPLGTDHLGRDYFALLLYGGRISLLVGVATIIVSMAIGTVLGVAAGYWGGKVDQAVNFILSIRLTLPVILVALVAVSVVGQSLLLLVLVIGGLLWERLVIVSRATTQQLVNREFVTAAQAIGSSTARILFREILPNISGPLIVIGTLELARAILTEATLSFLGLGVQAPLTSWGLMISEAKSQLLFRPWLVFIPATALVLLIFSINMLGDALRDVTAPEGRA
ncbi:MAG: ABC transporter permease [Burkholderiales bacterium]|nr:ABC transporter permease [Burkholderiales bacterium]